MDFRLLNLKGDPIADYPYLVLEVQAQPRRPDWFKIPDLSKACAPDQELYREGSEDTNAALQVFRRTALTCNDLLEADARLLADKVSSTYRMVSATSSERGARRPTAVADELPDLKEMNLYS